MSGLSLWPYFVLVAAGMVVAMKITAYLTSSATSLPPSPPADPILGHARILPPTGRHKAYADWGKRYGVLFTWLSVDCNH